MLSVGVKKPRSEDRTRPVEVEVETARRAVISTQFPYNWSPTKWIGDEGHCSWGGKTVDITYG
jgi:hypothetical protein